MVAPEERAPATMDVWLRESAMSGGREERCIGGAEAVTRACAPEIIRVPLLARPERSEKVTTRKNYYLNTRKEPRRKQWAPRSELKIESRTSRSTIKKKSKKRQAARNKVQTHMTYTCGFPHTKFVQNKRSKNQ